MTNTAPLTQEMFRFVSTRRVERALSTRVEPRLVRDLRTIESQTLLSRLANASSYAKQLSIANDFVDGASFVRDYDSRILELESAIVLLRDSLQRDAALPPLEKAFKAACAPAAALLQPKPTSGTVSATQSTLAAFWDSLYAQTVIGCDQYVSTNYLVDAIRVYHVIRLLWLSDEKKLATWRGFRFDEYDLLVANADASTLSDGVDTRHGGETSPVARDSALAMGARSISRVRGTSDAVLSGATAAAPKPAGTVATGTLFAAAPGAAAFRTELKVGAIKPPTVGDLILVEQELRRYEMGELAQIESIMKGERREHSVRNLSRTTQTTTTETTSETEQSSSLTTDERFQLSSQAQQTASQSLGVSTGVSVSGKFGPVQASASVNASYDTSQSSSTTNAQEYAKTVTEEATKRVKNSVKETSSVTVLTETQDIALRGFNNEKGATHVNGLYRWVDKIYRAQMQNYGRRLMLTFAVPEPAAGYRALLVQDKAEQYAGVVAPIPLSAIDVNTGRPIQPGTVYRDTEDAGVSSFTEITETNFALIAALYDVTDISPPPAKTVSGTKSIAVPSTMEAKRMDEHTDKDRELSYVSVDNTLTVPDGYRLTEVGVFAPTGPTGGFDVYSDATLLGKHNDTNSIQVTVGDRSFHLLVTGTGNDKSSVDTNFNKMQPVKPGDTLESAVQSPLGISLVADFEGMLAVTVVYTAQRTQEALDDWAARSYAAIVNGYLAKKNEYDQAITLAKANEKTVADALTFALRDDQYRQIEMTELKRGCIELISAGTAAGFTSISVNPDDGTPKIVIESSEGNKLDHWRAPLNNGAVADFFELAFEWPETTYQFYPYFWTGTARWNELQRATASDPVFEQFLRAGNSSVVVPVRPGYERAVMLFLRTGLIWGGGYLPLFDDVEVLNVYYDVGLRVQLDPPEPIGKPWEIRMPTSMVILQQGDALPEFPELPATTAPESEPELTSRNATTPF